MPIAARHQEVDLDAILAHARHLLLAGRNDEAYASYLEVLSRAPSHSAALHELGCLAYADGYRTAARTLYAQIVHNWPQDLIGHVNLGIILLEDRDFAACRYHFEAALEIDPNAMDAHRGLGQCLSDQGDLAMADQHWRRSFPGQALVRQLYRGNGPSIPVLLLVSTKGGNIPTRHILDDRTFAVTVLYAEYYRPDLPLPPCALIFNAIGDADLCSATLAVAEEIVVRTEAEVVNTPAQVRRTGRAANAAQFAAIPGIRGPRILALQREKIADAKTLTFPLLLRSQGFHTGQHFVRVESEEGLEAAAAGLPGETLLAITFLDARGPDGLVRKYRVMCIGGILYPMHLAISTDWKVHYFTADMALNAAYREEEQRFLENMPAVLNARVMATLMQVEKLLGLDYCGIDFALDGAGSVLLFEANATMVINPPPPEPIWGYKRAPLARALDAAKALLVAKSQQHK